MNSTINAYLCLDEILLYIFDVGAVIEHTANNVANCATVAKAMRKSIDTLMLSSNRNKVAN